MLKAATDMECWIRRRPKCEKNSAIRRVGADSNNSGVEFVNEGEALSDLLSIFELLHTLASCHTTPIDLVTQRRRQELL